MTSKRYPFKMSYMLCHLADILTFIRSGQFQFDIFARDPRGHSWLCPTISFSAFFSSFPLSLLFQLSTYLHNPLCYHNIYLHYTISAPFPVLLRFFFRISANPTLFVCFLCLTCMSPPRSSVTIVPFRFPLSFTFILLSRRPPDFQFFQSHCKLHIG